MYFLFKATTLCTLKLIYLCYISFWQVRVGHDISGVVLPVSGRYHCKNPKCPSVIESAKSAAQKTSGEEVDDSEWDDAKVLAHCPNGVSFNTMDKRCGAEKLATFQYWLHCAEQRAIRLNSRTTTTVLMHEIRGWRLVFKIRCVACL